VLGDASRDSKTQGKRFVKLEELAGAGALDEPLAPGKDKVETVIGENLLEDSPTSEFAEEEEGEPDVPAGGRDKSDEEPELLF
jgi:hypothetical protein